MGEEVEKYTVRGNKIRLFQSVDSHDSLINLLEILYTETEGKGKGDNRGYEISVPHKCVSSTLAYFNTSGLFVSVANNSPIQTQMESHFLGPNAILVIIMHF